MIAQPSDERQARGLIPFRCSIPECYVGVGSQTLNLISERYVGSSPTSGALNKLCYNGTMKIVEANIKGTMTARRINADFAKLSTVPNVDIVLWAESTYAKSKVALRRHYPSSHWEHLFMETEIPITVNTARFDVVRHAKLVTHTGKAHVSPARYIVWAILKDKKTGFEFVVTNSHWVSGGWKRFARQKSWRVAKWKTHYAKHKALVNEFHNAGYTVVGGGDWNWPTVTPFRSDMHYLAHHALDYIYLVNNTKGGVIFRIKSHGILAGYRTDHRPIWAEVVFVKASKNDPKRVPDAHVVGS
jgi:hypothetical protein